MVVVLGGGMYASGGLREYPEMAGVSYSRLVSGVDIFKRSGAKTLVLSGGSPIRSAVSEAEVMKVLAIELGVSEEQIITEVKSRNTMGQAINLAELLSATKKKETHRACYLGPAHDAFEEGIRESVFRRCCCPYSRQQPLYPPGMRC